MSALAKKSKKLQVIYLADCEKVTYLGRLSLPSQCRQETTDHAQINQDDDDDRFCCYGLCLR